MMKKTHRRLFSLITHYSGNSTFHHGQVDWTPCREDSRPCNHIYITRKPRFVGGELPSISLLFFGEFRLVQPEGFMKGLDCQLGILCIDDTGDLDL